MGTNPNRVSTPNPSSLTCLALILILSQQSLALDGKSEEVTDFRAVYYDELLPQISLFSEPGVTHFSEILFDSARDQLIVGARDALFKLSLEGLAKLENATWEASSSNVGICTDKGQSEDDCRNFIKVLVAHRDRLFVCGTYAFNPKCSWREIEDINRVIKSVDGRGKCPYSPKANSTALMTDKGDFYIGSAMDFSSNDHAIYRMSGSNFADLLRTIQYNSLWLSQPDFVGSFETSDFVYFVFRETAVEYINCGKTVYSRIARVCKNDKGGALVSKDNWTTYLKARLNCSVPGNYPFYYNEIQSVFYLKSESTIYGVFTTPPNSIAGSAVCSFDMEGIEDAFNGPFKKQQRSDSAWGPMTNDHSTFQCKESPNPGQSSTTSSDFQLVDKAVQPVTEQPIYQETLLRYTHIVVDTVEIKYQESPVHILFVATENGKIKKISFNRKRREACLVEILHPFPSEASKLNNLHLLPATNSLYLTTVESVIRIPTQRCQRFVSMQECINAMDPYCGWNKQKGECNQIPKKSFGIDSWNQNINSCPIVDAPVDGSWGKWSEWSRCSLNNPGFKLELNGDGCVCRKRNCNNPAPSNGGSICEGTDLEVTNCTQHGQWTTWSDWSACSNTCDQGVRQRKRTCGNPAPAFGGKTCIGQDVHSQSCENLPICQKSSSLIKELPATFASDAVFLPWTEWSQCSSECGKGFRSRQRLCVGSDRCSTSCTKEFAECDSSVCSDTTKVTDYTPWIRIHSSGQTDKWQEKRFQFSYTLPASSNSALTMYAGKIVAEDRSCTSSASCSKALSANSNDDDDWTEWSKCTRECGGGYQLKVKSCSPSDAKCFLSFSVAQRECNMQPCPGEWGCWSSWDQCDGKNGRRRTRVCKSAHRILSGDEEEPQCLSGSAVEESDCNGWGPWSEWHGECIQGDETLTRTRQCVESECAGNDKERKSCLDGSTTAVPSEQSGSVNAVVGSAFSGFLIGALIGAGLMFYYLRYFRPGVNGGSPHYVSAKSQNLYVSLPMLDLKNKHLSSNQSDCGTLRSTSTLRSKAGGSSIYSTSGKPGDYETATIKRSHSQRNSSLIVGAIRADINSDSLFT